MAQKHVIAPTGFSASGTPLSPGIKVGDTVYVSGQVGRHPTTGQMGSDIREQTRQTLTNLGSILAAAGLTMANVVNMRVVLRNTEDFPAFNEAFREFMAGEKITRTCVGATPHRKGVNVEIDCVASFE